MKYTIYYKQTKIGVLEINDLGQYKYTPDKNGLNEIKDRVSLGHALLEKSEWRKPIPFFKNRIDDAKKYPERFEGKEIGYHTDHFRMVPV